MVEYDPSSHSLRIPMRQLTRDEAMHVKAHDVAEKDAAKPTPGKAVVLAAIAALAVAACQPLPPEEIAQREDASTYLSGLRVARVCTSDGANNNFVLIGTDNRLWVSYYSQPDSWSYLTAVAPGIAPKDVC